MNARSAMPSLSRRAFVSEIVNDAPSDLPDCPEGARLIPLHKSTLAAVIDEDDFEFISTMRWKPRPGPEGVRFAAYQAPGFYRDRAMSMHRIITRIYGAPDVVVDHINGDALDNRRANLRICTQQQNLWNRRKFKGASPYKGVQLEKDRRQITANIMVAGKGVRLGYFRSEIDAALAYDAAARLHFGEYACVNFPGPTEQGALPPDVLNKALEELACLGQNLASGGQKASSP